MTLRDALISVAVSSAFVLSLISALIGAWITL